MTNSNQTVYLISCSKTKADGTRIAKEMYISALFKKSIEFAESQGGEVAILSAKYGVILPDDIIDTYNITLNDMDKEQKIAWAMLVYNSLVNRFGINKDYCFLAGKSYYQELVKIMKPEGIRYSIMMESMGIGQRLKFLNEQLKIK